MADGHGPAAHRLRDYVQGARPDSLAAAADSWLDTVRKLNDTRAILRRVSERIETELSGEFAATAKAHLDRVAETTIERQREVREASFAMQASAQALEHARMVYAQTQSGSPAGTAAGYTVGDSIEFIDPHSVEAIQASRYRDQQSRHDARQFSDSEQQAAAETAYLDHVFSQTDASMGSVEPTSSTEVSHPVAWDAAAPPSEAGRGQDPTPIKPDDPPGPQGPPKVPATPGQPPTVPAQLPGHPPAAPGIVPPETTPSEGGAAQGPVLTSPTPTVSGGGSTYGGSGGSGFGAGTAGLAFGAGGLGAGGLAAGVRGGLSASGLAGVRGIGAGGPVAAPGSGVLGRGAGGAGAGGARGATGGRAGGVGRAGGRAGGAGGTLGSRRGLGAGAGAGGRKRDDDERDRREVLDEDPDQWLDDDATGPEVMGLVPAPPEDTSDADVDGEAVDAAETEGGTVAEPVDLEAMDLDDLDAADLADADLEALDLADDDLDDADLAGWLQDPAPQPDRGPDLGPDRSSGPTPTTTR